MSPTPIPLNAPVADEQRWAAIVATAPTMAATMLAYLDQIAVSLRPRSVEAADNALRSLATYLVGEPRLRRLKGLRRDHVEGYKLWLAQRPAGRGKTISARTVRHRLGMLRVFFERIIDWGWDDAPKSCPILQADLPRVDEPLPRFLDDAQAAALMRAAAVADPLDRLVVETLARTGLRVGELSPWRPTPWSSSVPPNGCACRSASFAMTATCRCIRCWWSFSRHGGPATPTMPC